MQQTKALLHGDHRGALACAVVGWMPPYRRRCLKRQRLASTRSPCCTVVRHPVQTSKAHQRGASTGKEHCQDVVHLTAYQHVDTRLPPLQRAGGLGVVDDVLQPRHRHFNWRTLGVDTPSKDKGIVLLPAVTFRYTYRGFFTAHFFNTCAYVVE